jgi:hypothetical protein
MPKVTYNEVVRGYSGTISDLVYYEADGQQLVRKKPRGKKPRTKPQQNNSGRFTAAGRYARQALSDPNLKAAYQALCRGHQNPRNLAIRDFLTPPVIEAVDFETYTGKPQQVLRVKATDDFRVGQVHLVIRDPGGTIIEEGVAVLDAGSGQWCYTTRVEIASGLTVSITVSATDQPGNTIECQRWHYLRTPAST